MLNYSLLKPSHTQLLVDLVRQCYGDNYAHDYFYDATVLAEKITDGSLFCAIATDRAGHVVANMSIRIEYPGDHTADNFAGMMLPEYRGQGLLMQLGTTLFPTYQSLALCGLQTATVTHHTISQKISSNTGTVTVGCLLADSQGSNADGLVIESRMPILMQFYPFETLSPRTLNVTEHYQSILARIFNQLSILVSFNTVSVNTVANQPHDAPSQFEQPMDSRRGTALLRFRQIGADASHLLAQFMKDGNDLPATYIDVPLRDDAAIDLIHAANNLGYFFGGIIFDRAKTDFLRLQRCQLPPTRSRAGIVDSFALELVDVILHDYQRITHGSGQ